VTQPKLAAGVASSALHPATGWGDLVRFAADGDHYEAAVALTVHLRFDERRLDIDHTETWEAILFPVSKSFDAASLIEVDHDPRDFVDIENDVPFSTPTAPLSQTSYFRTLRADVKRHLDSAKTISVLYNGTLRIASRPGEPADAFDQRIERVASDGADKDSAKLRDKYGARFRKAQRGYEDALRAADTAQQAADDARGSAILGIGLDLLSGRKPRLSSSSQRSARGRLRRTEDKIETKRRAIEDLNADLEDDLVAIQRKWDDASGSVETVEIGLESDDIQVTDVRVVWIRT